MTGLTLAHRLSGAGHAVTLFEAAPELGGLASAWRLGPITWDKHYHVTLLSDLHTRGILRELGLEPEMQWVETATGFFAEGRLYPLSNALDYLRLPVLTPIQKVRLAFTILYGSRIRDWRRLERTPLENWLVRCSGRGTFEQLWRPLLRAKLGDGYRESSAAFIWATLRRLYAARHSGLKKEMFGYVPGGYARILARFAEVLIEKGVVLRLGEPIRSVGARNGALEVELASGRRECFDRAVVTLTPRGAARLCRGLSRAELHQLESVRYQGIVCPSVLLRRPLANYYLTYITDPGAPFTAVTEMSAFVDRSHFDGNALVYLPKYAAPDDPVFALSDEELQDRFLAAVADMYPGFDRDDVLCFRVSRVREVFPIPVLGYSSHLPPMATSVPGLHLVSSAHIVNGTLNVNETVQLAERAARSLLDSDGRRLELFPGDTR
jgi:protoporphyrinogen oxidase